MPSQYELVIAALKDIYHRDLTEEEENGVQIWTKCREIAHFVESYPLEWKIFREMLESYLDDFRQQWDEAQDRDPAKVGNLEVMHAQVYGAKHVITAFIRDVQNAPNLAKEVPETVKEGYRQMKSMPVKV